MTTGVSCQWQSLLKLLSTLDCYRYPWCVQQQTMGVMHRLPVGLVVKGKCLGSFNGMLVLCRSAGGHTGEAHALWPWACGASRHGVQV